MDAGMSKTSSSGARPRISKTSSSGARPRISIAMCPSCLAPRRRLDVRGQPGKAAPESQPTGHFTPETWALFWLPTAGSWLLAPRQFIAFPGRFPARAAHNFIESLITRARPPLREVLRRLESRNLFRHRCGHKLVDARAIIPAQPLDRLFERPGQP